MTLEIRICLLHVSPISHRLMLGCILLMLHFWSVYIFSIPYFWFFPIFTITNYLSRTKIIFVIFQQFIFSFSIDLQKKQKTTTLWVIFYYSEILFLLYFLYVLKNQQICLWSVWIVFLQKIGWLRHPRIIFILWI